MSRAAADPFEALAQLEREIHALRERVAALESRRPSRESDERLIAALASTVGARVFCAASVARTRDGELRAAIGARDVRRIGLWLRRLRGRPIAGYQLERITRDGRGTWWTLRVV